jgi:hypothetical protein
MMNLDQLQRIVLSVIQQPLTAAERMRKRTLDGRPVREIVDEIVKSNDRMTSIERLEIYNRVYWFRILDSLAEDFPGLRAVVGQTKFDKLLVAYLSECPSESFTLRDLGSRLEPWLRDHLELVAGMERIALDVVRLEWADIEAFDSSELPRLTEADLASLGDNPTFHLQPYLRLLDLAYPVDRLLLSIRDNEDHDSDMASNVFVEHASRVPDRELPLPEPEAVYLAVHRQDLVVYFKRLAPEAFALLIALQEGKHLSEAIEAAVNSVEQNIESQQLHEWFANWASLGWFHRPSEN